MCGSGALDACWTTDRGTRSMAPALTQATHQRQALSLHTLWQSTGKKKRQRPNISQVNKVDEGGHCQQTALDPLRTPPQDAPAVASAPFSYPAQRNGYDSNVNSTVQCGGTNGKIMGLQQRTGADNLVNELDAPIIDDVVKGDRAPSIDDNVDDILQVFSSIASEVGAEQAVAAVELGLSVAEQQLLQEAAAVINLCPLQEDKETVALQRLQQAQARLQQLEQRCDQALRRACRLTTRQSSQAVAGHVGSVERHLRETLSIRPARSAGVQNLYSWAEDGRLPTREEVRSIPTATLVSLVNKLQAPPTPQVNNRRYFGFGPSRSAAPSATGDSKLPTAVAKQLDSLSGTWSAQLRHLQRFDDPDATESSSGGESDEEGPVPETQVPLPVAEAPENPEAQTRPISLYRRAIWLWYRERATIASKWTWLQAQIADLEYRIRQHTDLYRQLRASKRPIQLATPLGAVTGHVSTPSDVGECETASRTCGVGPCTRRRLIRASMLGTTWRGTRNANARCACVAGDETCVLCAGKSLRQPSVNVDPDGMALKERISMVDRGFHPVLSTEKDVPTGVHVDSLLKTGDWRNNLAGQASGHHHIVHVDQEDPAVTKRKHATAKRKSKMAEEGDVQGSKLERRKLLLKKRKRVATCSDLMDEDSCSFPPHSPFSVTGGDGASTGAAALLRSRERHSLQDIIRRRTSYDIDNIVIPASMIATSRVEKWEYKEIITPKWRLIEEMNAEEAKKEHLEEAEDISDEAYRARHDRSEAEERRKFLSYLKPKVGTRGRQRRTERADSRAESSGANSPDPLSPHPEQGVDVVGEPGNEEGTPVSAPRRLSLSNDKEETLMLKGIKERRSAMVLNRNRETCRGYSEENSVMAWDFDEQFAITPYEPRLFPIVDADYEQMVAEMPEEDFPPSRSTRTRKGDDEDPLSSQPASSAASVDPEPDPEDPDDPEWEGVASKSRKR